MVVGPFGAGPCLIIIGLFFAKKLYVLNHLTIGDYFSACSLDYSRVATGAFCGAS